MPEEEQGSLTPWSGAAPPWWTDPTKNVETLVETSDRRQDNLREAEVGALRREMELRAEYEDKLRKAESDRINAIRSVDVGNVAAAAQVAETRANTLAQQVITTADAFRAAMAAALEPIQKSIEDLRRAQYEAQGQKSQVSDTRLNMNVIIGAIALLFSAIVVVIGLYAALHK
jgi:hypothetical protein